MEERFQVGVITSPHGVRGEVKVFPTTDDPGRFKKLREVILVQNRGEKTVEIEQVKFLKQMVILKLKGFDNRNDVEGLRDAALFVPRASAVRLKRDEYFIADLIGLEVRDEQDETIGELRDVLSTGANDVYEIILQDGRELLLPAIRECVLKVSVEEGYIKIHILEGLL